MEEKLARLSILKGGGYLVVHYAVAGKKRSSSRVCPGTCWED